MPWQPKSTAPAYFRLQDAFQGLIMSDNLLEWLLAWLPIMDPLIVTTADFCAGGPPPNVPSLQLSEFAGIVGAGWAGNALSVLGIKGRLEDVAKDRIFQAYCEQPATTGGCADIGILTLQPGTHYTGAATYPPDDLIHIPTGGSGIHLSNIPTNAGTINVHWFVNGVYGGLIASGGPTWATPGVFNVDFTPHTDATGSVAVVSPNGPVGTVINACLPGATAAVGHTATPQPQPAGLIPPTTRTYANIADLGAELDRQEFKLDMLVAWVSWLTQNTVTGPGPATSAPVTDPVGPLVDPKAIGWIVSVTGIPPSAAEKFGDPVQYRGLGRITLGSAKGWLPSQDLSHTPMLVSPVPPGADRIEVKCWPPAHATVTALYPPK